MNSPTEDRRDQTRVSLGQFSVHGTIQTVQGFADGFADIVSPLGALIEFQMVDFSVRGYQIRADVPVQVQTEILIHFSDIGLFENFLEVNKEEFDELSHVMMEHPDIDCLGTVSWCEPAQHGFHLGVALREASLHRKFLELFASIDQPLIPSH